MPINQNQQPLPQLEDYFPIVESTARQYVNTRGMFGISQAIAINLDGTLLAYMHSVSGNIIVEQIGQLRTSENLKKTIIAVPKNMWTKLAWTKERIVLDLTFLSDNILLISTACPSTDRKHSYEGGRVWSLNIENKQILNLVTEKNCQAKLVENISNGLLPYKYASHFVLNVSRYDDLTSSAGMNCGRTELRKYDVHSNKYKIIEAFSDSLANFKLDNTQHPIYYEKITTHVGGRRNTTTLFKKNEEGEWESILTGTSTARSYFRIVGYSQDWQKVYVLDGRKTPYTSLRCYDLKTDSSKVLYQLKDRNIVSASFISGKNNLQMLSLKKDTIVLLSEKDKPALHFLENIGKENEEYQEVKISKENTFLNAISREFNKLDYCKSFLMILSGSTKVAVVTDPQNLAKLNVIEFKTGAVLNSISWQVRQLNVLQHLVPMEPVIFKSRDQLDLVSYVSLPKKRIPDQPVPFVVIIHGGPQARDKWRYRADVQFLASLGIGSVLINFRGSIGFGKNFCNAGNGGWGLKMLDDIEDVVLQLKKNGVMGEAVVAGYSYGGYAALAAMAFKPKLFKACISGAGPTDLKRCIDDVKSTAGKKHWARLMLKKPDYLYNEDERQANKSFLDARSPLFAAHRVTGPVLLISPKEDHTTDERILYHHTERMAQALEKNGKEVTEIQLQNKGGHSLELENISIGAAICSAFLAKHFNLPINTRDLEYVLRRAPDCRVMRGIEHIPGLRRAVVANNVASVRAYIVRRWSVRRMMSLQPKAEIRVIADLIGSYLFDQKLYMSAWRKAGFSRVSGPLGDNVKRVATVYSYLESLYDPMHSKQQHAIFLMGGLVASYLVKEKPTKQIELSARAYMVTAYLEAFFKNTQKKQKDNITAIVRSYLVSKNSLHVFSASAAKELLHCFDISRKKTGALQQKSNNNSLIPPHPVTA